MYPSTTGRFSATIGYVAPTPNHVQNIMFNNRKSGSQSHTQYAMNKMFKVKPSQGHKPRIPQIPQREHIRERPTKVGPHFAQETTHPHSPSHHRPKKRSRNPPPNPCRPGPLPILPRQHHAHQKPPAPKLHLVIQGRGHGPMSRRSATAPSSFWHTVCP